MMANSDATAINSSKIKLPPNKSKNEDYLGVNKYLEKGIKAKIKNIDTERQAIITNTNRIEILEAMGFTWQIRKTILSGLIDMKSLISSILRRENMISKNCTQITTIVQVFAYGS